MENYNYKLFELYTNWIHQVPDKFFHNCFSNPYLISVPESWSYKKYRIMIVGEEGFGLWGAGKDEFSPKTKEGLNKIIEYNRNYFDLQVHERDKRNKSYNKSPFWQRIRRIDDLDQANISFVWTNIDKIHFRNTDACCCRIGDNRKDLHGTNIKVLDEEIKILRPTHIVFFGWYFISMEMERPDLYHMINNWYIDNMPIDLINKKEQNKWKQQQIITGISAIDKNNDDKFTAIFTYHPGWYGKNRPKGYEDKVIETIKNTLQ